MNLIGISGSPSLQSRSGWLLDAARERLATRAQQYVPIAVRELPAEALLHARFDDPAIRAALATVARADVVIVATPIYKAAYSGLLKTFLDLLPQDGLRGKTVLPLVTGGSPGHLLALDYALKPVLASLGARDILDGVFATDQQIRTHDTGFAAGDELVERLDRALEPLLRAQRPVRPPLNLVRA